MMLHSLGGRSPRGERGLKWSVDRQAHRHCESLPARGAWIEMVNADIEHEKSQMSLPARGAWIEISTSQYVAQIKGGRSPRGERGLKYYHACAVD